MAVILDFGLARDFSHTYARDMKAKIVTHPLYKANPLANEPMNSTSTDVLTICMLKKPLLQWQKLSFTKMHVAINAQG